MADDAKIIDEAVEKFRSLMESQLARAKKIKEDKDFTDYDALDTIVIGICGGDGIGPIITKEKRESSCIFFLKMRSQAAKFSLRKLTV